MSEYWVSQAKHYCKYCNTWIADNKPCRTNHDNSVKHKQNFDKFLKDKKEKTFHGQQNERELKKQMLEIEKAANDAIQSDRQSSSYQQQNFYHSSSLLPSSKLSDKQSGSFSSSTDQYQHDDALAPQETIKEQS